MAKLLPYVDPDILDIMTVKLNHLWLDHPFEPGAYHTLYPYGLYDGPASADAWQVVPVLLQDAGDRDLRFARGLVMCRAWASMPWLMHDRCTACHYLRSGPGLPRWNIARGGHRLNLPSGVGDYDTRLIRTYVQRYDDPAPPGR